LEIQYRGVNGPLGDMVRLRVSYVTT